MAAPVIPSRRILIMLLVTAIVLMTFDGRGSGVIKSARGTVIGVTAPVRSAIGWAFSPIGDAWTGAVHYDNVVDENAELRARVAELEGEIAQLPDSTAELAELREVLDLDFASDQAVITAEIVEDRDTGLERILEIDRGSADGIVPAMAVVTGSGLVGRVIQVNSGHRSVIRLITDGRMNVGVAAGRTGTQGLASGSGSSREMEVDLSVDGREDVRDGDLLHTTGFASSKYPGQLPVGILRIDELGGMSLELSADFEHLQFVTIILSVPENP